MTLDCKGGLQIFIGLLTVGKLPARVVIPISPLTTRLQFVIIRNLLTSELIMKMLAVSEA